MSHRRTILSALSATAFPFLLAAQQTSDPTIDRIFRVGMDSSHLQALAQVLFDSIGPRLTGSPGMTAASDWVIKTYGSWGIDAKREQYGTWRGWTRGPSHIDLVRPRVRSVEGTMLAWSPGTHGRPIEAEAIILPKFADSTEFVRWLPQARGKLVLISPGWPTCRPSEDWIRYATPASKARMDTAVAKMLSDWSVDSADGRPDSARLYRGTGYTLGLGTGSLGLRLEKAGVVGILSSRPKLSFANPSRPARSLAARGFGGQEAPNARSMRGGGRSSSNPLQSLFAAFGFDPNRGTGGWGTIEVFETYDTIAPAVGLSCEDYGLVFRMVQNDQHPMVRLDLTSQLNGEQPAFNTIGMIRGVEKPDEYVMLSAHFDSWDGSSGSTDNGTGTLMAMEAMRILKLVYPRPKRTILVGHWASEEHGLVGSRAFAEDHPEVLKGLQGLFNQDNGTGRALMIIGAGLTDMGPHLRDWYSKLPSFYTDSLSSNVVSWSFSDRPTGNPGGTDGSTFACYGAPAFDFFSLDWNYGSYTWHTNRDTYDKVVFDDLKHNAVLAAELAYLASEDPAFISRERSPGEWPANWPANCGKAPRKTRPRF